MEATYGRREYGVRLYVKLETRAQFPTALTALQADLERDKYRVVLHADALDIYWNPPPPQAHPQQHQPSKPDPSAALARADQALHQAFLARTGGSGGR